MRELLRTDPDFDYPIFMGTAEYNGYEPSGRMIAEPGEKTDLAVLWRILRINRRLLSQTLIYLILQTDSMLTNLIGGKTRQSAEPLRD